MRDSAAWIETARRAIEAWNREDLDAFLRGVAPPPTDCEWRPAFPRSLERSRHRLNPRPRGIARSVARRPCECGRRYTAHALEDAQDRRRAAREWSGHVVARGRRRSRTGLGVERTCQLSGELTLSAWDWLDRDEALPSRRAVGVGDVAGERRGRFAANQRLVNAAGVAPPLRGPLGSPDRDQEPDHRIEPPRAEQRIARCSPTRSAAKKDMNA